MTDNCALNPDGSLKDASEIAWVHSPSHEHLQLPETHAGGGSSATAPGLTAPAPTAPSKGTGPSLKRKRGEPESRSKSKPKGQGIERIKSLNTETSGKCKIEPQ